MRDERVDYDRAHAVCARLEFELRRDRGVHASRG